MTLGNESFSIELWFKSAGGSVDWYLLHKGSHATNSYEGATGKWFGIQYQKNSKNDRLTWAIDDNVTKTDINVTGATTKYFNNEWVHLVCVRDVEEKQLKMYANGILVASGADKTGDIGTIERSGNSVFCPLRCLRFDDPCGGFCLGGKDGTGPTGGSETARGGIRGCVSA